MGGCRCSFRDCENGTASRKDLHYFRYPVRDPERLKEWARLANRMEFLELPRDKLANKVVCQEHFERNMFMNYLCDRLSRLAIPRLMPQRDSSVLNVDTGDILWLEEDNGSAESGTDVCNQPAAVHPAPLQKSQIKIEHVEPLKNWKEPSPEPPHKKIKILNSDTLVYGGKSERPQNVIRFSTTSGNPDLCLRASRASELRKVCKPQLKLAGTAQIEMQNDNETHTLLEIEEVENFETTYEQTKAQSVSHATLGTGKVPPTSKTRATRSATLASIPMAVSDPALVEQVERSNSEIAQLKQMVQELLDRPPPKPQQVNVVQPSAVAQKVVMEKGPQLTKAQLFSSIKRYLNPTMVTLLRMELFSGPSERQWKPDEKSLAVDLMEIGEQVYDHFTEEFRFRLPPKAHVKEWKESGEIDADDAC